MFFKFCFTTISFALSCNVAYASCASVSEQTTPGLYFKNGSQLIAYDQENNELKLGKKYSFVHVFPMKSERNSVAVVKILKSGLVKGNEELRNKVRLERDKINFACVPSTGELLPRESFGKNGKKRFVSFETYNEYTRYKIRIKNSNTVENEFHTFYNNGNICISTKHYTRLKYFLLKNSDFGFKPYLAFLNKPLREWRFIGRANASSEINTFGEASAAHVKIKEYKRKLNTRGCVSFSDTANSEKTLITIADLESAIEDKNNIGGKFYKEYIFQSK
jgi:hypothetical protein